MRKKGGHRWSRERKKRVERVVCFVVKGETWGLAERGECRELHEQKKGVLILYFESLKGSLGLIIGGRDPKASFFLFLSFKISCFPIFVIMI